MPLGRRNSLGRFVRSEPAQYDPAYNFPVPKGWSIKLIYVIIFIFLISPWIFMMFKNKNNLISTISDFTGKFYENHFSCRCPSNCTYDAPANTKKDHSL